MLKQYVLYSSGMTPGMMQNWPSKTLTASGPPLGLCFLDSGTHCHTAALDTRKPGKRATDKVALTTLTKSRVWLEKRAHTRETNYNSL